MHLVTSANAGDLAQGLAARKRELNARWNRVDPLLVAAEIRQPVNLEEVEALRAEVAAITEETNEVYRLEREASAKVAQARAKMAMNPGALIHVAEGRYVGQLIQLLGAFPDDPWAERIVRKASEFLNCSRNAGYTWGFQWEEVVDDVRAFAAERGIGRAA